MQTDDLVTLSRDTVTAVLIALDKSLACLAMLSAHNAGIVTDELQEYGNRALTAARAAITDA